MATRQVQLSNFVQASFGVPDDPDYVFDITVNEDKSVMAVSLSTNAIKLYDPRTGSFKKDILGHNGTISGLKFPDPNSPFLLFSCSADKTIKAWDMRIVKQVATLTARDELWSFSTGGSPQTLIAGGSNAEVLIWDWRTRKLLGASDSHSDAVTQVEFHPTNRNQLFTASVDGLINVLDAKSAVERQEPLEQAMNPGTSLSKFGFFGIRNEMIWVLTHIETLSIWNVEEYAQVAEFGDTRTKASYNWNLNSVSYLINCHSRPGTEDLWLAAGNNDGAVGYFPVTYDKRNADSARASVGVVGNAGATLEGGHQDVVRTIWLNPNEDSEEPLHCWTGGEDGRLCRWSTRGSEQRGQAWFSSDFVTRRESNSGHRHAPY